VQVKGEKMTAQKPEWFEITENTPATGIRKVNKKLPIAAIAVAGAIIVAGSIFANANDGPAAVADTQQTLTSPAPTSPQPQTASQSAAPAPQTASQSAAPAPQISTSPHNSIRGEEREDREHDGKRWGDHEDRERGNHEGREHDGDRGGDDD
jgi:hypothetical protein